MNIPSKDTLTFLGVIGSAIISATAIVIASINTKKTANAAKEVEERKGNREEKKSEYDILRGDYDRVCLERDNYTTKNEELEKEHREDLARWDHLRADWRATGITWEEALAERLKNLQYGKTLTFKNEFKDHTLEGFNGE